jgi:hypothetical protein
MVRRRQSKAIDDQLAKHRAFETVRHHQRLGASIWATRQELQRAALLIAQLRHRTQVSAALFLRRAGSKDGGPEPGGSAGGTR